jgi:hypothetical protein
MLRTLVSFNLWRKPATKRLRQLHCVVSPRDMGFPTLVAELRRDR